MSLRLGDQYHAVSQGWEAGLERIRSGGSGMNGLFPILRYTSLRIPRSKILDSRFHRLWAVSMRTTTVGHPKYRPLTADTGEVREVKGKGEIRPVWAATDDYHHTVAQLRALVSLLCKEMESAGRPFNHSFRFEVQERFPFLTQQTTSDDADPGRFPNGRHFPHVRLEIISATALGIHLANTGKMKALTDETLHYRPAETVPEDYYAYSV